METTSSMRLSLWLIRPPHPPPSATELRLPLELAQGAHSPAMKAKSVVGSGGGGKGDSVGGGEEDISAAFKVMDTDGDGGLAVDELAAWIHSVHKVGPLLRGRSHITSAAITRQGKSEC